MKKALIFILIFVPLVVFIMTGMKDTTVMYWNDGRGIIFNFDVYLYRIKTIGDLGYNLFNISGKFERFSQTLSWDGWNILKSLGRMLFFVIDLMMIPWQAIVLCLYSFFVLIGLNSDNFLSVLTFFINLDFSSWIQ